MAIRLPEVVSFHFIATDLSLEMDSRCFEITECHCYFWIFLSYLIFLCYLEVKWAPRLKPRTFCRQ